MAGAPIRLKLTQESKTMPRQLIHDKNIKGWRCDSCGWAWPTPRFVPAHQNVNQAPQEDFDKHTCSKHPLPRSNGSVKITLMAAGKILGTTEWDHLPNPGNTILLVSENTQAKEVRSVDKIEEDPSGGKIVHLGGVQPTFEFHR
jgi:hypothetical protein